MTATAVDNKTVKVDLTGKYFATFASEEVTPGEFTVAPVLLKLSDSTDKYLPLFDDVHMLRKVLKSAGVKEQFSIKQITNGEEFVQSFPHRQRCDDGGAIHIVTNIRRDEESGQVRFLQILVN